MLAIRTLYWRYLNDPYRDTARRLIEKGRDPITAFKASDLQIENMRALLALLERHRSHEVVMRAEIHRELGEFKEAALLLAEGASEDEEADNIYTAALRRVSAPLPVIYAWQSTMRAF